MDAVSPPEARKSRSKTPFFRLSSDHDSCLSANGDQIQHDERTHEETSCVEVDSTTGQVIQNKIRSSQLKTQVLKSNFATVGNNPSVAKTQITIQSIVTKKTEKNHKGANINRSSGSSLKEKSSKLLSHKSGSPQKSKEIIENEINSSFEKSNMFTSTPLNSQFSSPTNGDLSNHIAYNEYREAGEYWNKFPKTDYTYSKLSRHRREIAPGIIAMPNMSRRSLMRHGERVSHMIEQNPSEEMFIRKRYAASDFQDTRSLLDSSNFYYDSQEEIDADETRNYRNILLSRNKTSKETFLIRILSKFVAIFYSFISFFSKNEDGLHYMRIQRNNEGIFGRVKSALKNCVLSVLRWLYICISTVLYVDTLVLRSTSESKNKKRFLLFLLLLLPLLLLGVWKSLDEQQQIAVIIRTRNLVPMTLLGFGNIFPSNWKESLKIIFPSITPRVVTSESSQLNYATITTNLQKSLSPEQYDNIVSHINVYVQKLVEDKLLSERQKANQREANIPKEMSTLITNIVRENIMDAIHLLPTPPNSPYQLSEDDIQKIAQVVQVHLLTEHPNSEFVLSQENLKEISKLIKYYIEANKQNFKLMDPLDINKILLKILKSPSLMQFVNNGKSEAFPEDIISRQQLLVDDLGREISLIKAKLSENLKENTEGLYNSIDLLKTGHNQIIKSLENQEKATNARFDTFLSEINSKISSINEQQFTLINKQIKLSILDILGYKDVKNVEDISLQDLVRNTFIVKEFLEAKILEMNLQTNENIKKQIEDTKVLLMQEVSKKLQAEVLKIADLKQKENNRLQMTSIPETDIRKIVRDVLAVYDADKTGLVDYALESAGGQVLSTRCTENYQTKSAQISIFGIPLWYPSNTPRIAISPAVQPGECWAFQGFPGFLVLKLNSMVYVTGFTMEHIPKSLAPNGKIDSAPKNFSIWGLADENDQEPALFGEYEYEEDGSALQYFTVQNDKVKRPFDIVELRIETNHGNPGYTCLYRFRVHGTPAS